MAAPVLSDYRYMYKDTGILLNGDWDGSYPGFIDVEKVSGLDLPDFEPASYDNDGQHGGNTFVKYAKQRTIVIEGVMYTTAASADVFLEKLIANFLPDNVSWPFYFKPSGVAQRYVNAKAIALKSDIDTARRIGSAPIQIQLVAEDPTKRVDNANQVMTSGTNYTIANTGTIATYPIVTIVGAFTAITFTNNDTAKTLTITTTRIAGDVTVVDFRQRSVTINGIQSSSVASGTWWPIMVGGDSVKATVTGGPPTSITMASYSGWL